MLWLSVLIEVKYNIAFLYLCRPRLMVIANKKVCLEYMSNGFFSEGIVNKPKCIAKSYMRMLKSNTRK